MMTNAARLDATEIASSVASGTLTASEVAEAIIARYEMRDAEVRAWAFFEKTQLRDQAAQLDKAEVKGPLHGVPIAVKDVIATRDMPTAHNTPRYANSRTGVDAACVDTLRAAGALIVGKSVTTEFAATGRGGVTRNPLDLTRTPGGSSSGSAAAVADFQSALGLGTQTGGSTIRPASFNGIWGMKPTWNSISREGLKMYGASCDTLGLYARSARDLALLADVFELDPLEAPSPTTIAGLKIAFCKTPVWDRAQPATVAAMETAVRVLREHGAEVSELVLPDPFNGFHAAHWAVLRREGRSAFLNEYRNTPDLHDEFKLIVENRQGLTAADARAAYRLADSCRAMFDDIAAGYDAIITPSAAGEAPVGQDLTGDASFNSMWTLLQVPVVNVPGLSGPAGMPVGISVTARRYEDRKVIAIASLIGTILAS